MVLPPKPGKPLGKGIAQQMHGCDTLIKLVVNCRKLILTILNFLFSIFKSIFKYISNLSSINKTLFFKYISNLSLINITSILIFELFIQNCLTTPVWRVNQSYLTCHTLVCPPEKPQKCKPNVWSVHPVTDMGEMYDSDHVLFKRHDLNQAEFWLFEYFYQCLK